MTTTIATIARGLKQSCLVLTTSIILCACATLARSQTQATTAPSLDAQLEAADARAAEIEDLVADFEQQKFSSLLRDPLVTTGQVLARRSTMLWRGQTPEPTRMRVTLERMEIYYVKQNLVEDYPIVGKLGSLAASPLPRLATLRERFKLERDNGVGLEAPSGVGAPIAVRLTPIEDEVKQYVNHVRVLLDTNRGIVMAFELTDPDGERTLIRFSNVRTNTNLADEDLELDAPRNVKVVKPLEPGK